LDETGLKIIQNKCQPDDLMYLSNYREIKNEVRFWVCNEQIITYSKYHNNINVLDRDLNITFDLSEDGIEEMKKDVQNIVNAWTPDDMFTIDMCQCDGQIKVVEFNCWSTSGFYLADMTKILDATANMRFGYGV